MAQKTFDFNQCSFILGTHIISGFAQGNAIEIGYIDTPYNISYDLNYGTTRYRKNNYDAEATIVLVQASISNAVLSQLAALDRQSDTGIVPLLVKDNKGDTLITSPACWVKEVTKVGFGDDNKDRTWVLHMHNAAIYDGGIK